MKKFTPKNTKQPSEKRETAVTARNHPWTVRLALILLGATATVGWSPLEQIWIAWAAFAALSASITAAPGPLEALLRCFCFALGLHTVGHGWVFSALLHQTDVGLLWSLAGSALFLTYLTLFLAIPVFFFKWLSGCLDVWWTTRQTLKNLTAPFCSDPWRWQLHGQDSRHCGACCSTDSTPRSAGPKGVIFRNPPDPAVF